MTARILLVDDMEINLRLLEARLRAEYFEVVTVDNGAEAIEICRTQPIDLVLLDVMMPEMDGYEVCRRMKREARTMHIPVVLITALDQPADRVTGLQAGADDFLTKPVRDLQLFSRIKNLARLKRLTDELRERAATAVNLLSREELDRSLADDGARGHLALFEENDRAARRIAGTLRAEHIVDHHSEAAAFLKAASHPHCDLVLINLAAERCDPLRLCSQLRSADATRQLPILAIAEPEREEQVARALELGANDYILRPVDGNELTARVRTQIKRKRYDDELRRSLTKTIELAVTDPLTGLHNRRFFEHHLERLLWASDSGSKPPSLLIADIDHFKRINDGWGHDAGDAVLKQFALRLTECLRSSDLASRFGGEEFVVLMPDADAAAAMCVAERIRKRVADEPFDIGGEMIPVTVSAGFSVFEPGRDDADSFLKRADRSLYAAKRDGRNRVIALAA